MSALCLWRVGDGRRGHDAQSRGLLAALGRRSPCRVFEIPALPWPRACALWLRGAFPPGAGLPDPDLIIGAGHGTHATMLAARRARGGRIVALMRPTLPGACFDLCIVPGHDPAPRSGHVLRSVGPLNAFTADGPHDPARGIVLVGGPSRHHGWDAPALAARLHAVLATPGMAWTVTDSPRTPPAQRAQLAALPGVRYAGWDAVDETWLPAELRECGVAWITADSLSMIFEALTAGVAVGVLPVPERRPGRVPAAVADLIARGLVTPFAAWQQGRVPAPASPPLREADRCAAQVLAWLGAGASR
jgi:hypothetical protein